MRKVGKVPVIMQMEAAECGAASLAMILAYHGKFVPLERLRIDCGVSRDGVNANSIILAGKLHNLNTYAYSKDINELEGLPLPAIIHWKFNHFVVLCGFHKKGFVINDPAVGRIIVPYDEFDKSFTGIILCFEKGARFEKSGRKQGGFLLRYLRENTAELIFISLLSFVIAAVNVAIPVFSKLFINDVLTERNTGSLGGIIFAMVITLIVMVTGAFLREKYLLKMRAKFALVSNARFMWKMLSLPLEFFTQRFTGELTSRQSANDDVAAVFCGSVLPIGINLIMLIAYAAVLTAYGAKIAVLGIIAAIVNMALIMGASRTRKNLTLRLRRDLGQYEGHVAAGIDMMETIMSCGSEDGFFEKWTGFAAKAANSKTELARKAMFTNAAPGFISAAANAAVLCLGVYEVLAGRLTIGSLAAVQAFLNTFLTPVYDLAESAGDIQSIRGQIERLEDTQKYPVHESWGDDDAPLADIKVENLEFNYNPLGEPIVKNISFDVPRGMRMGLTGGTGCGKSTVAKLIAGLYEPAGGGILFGGKTKAQIDKDAFYSSVASVDQEIALFEGSVMDNITMWDESVSHEDAVRAARDACIHDDITMRPGGYFSPVLADGQNFSGGQKQRLEIARALAKNPNILIMDEATSALDAKIEADVTKAVKERGITCIIIAHRLSAIRDCDEIIVLERGVIAERGTHDELKNKGGLYSELFNAPSESGDGV